MVNVGERLLSILAPLGIGSFEVASIGFWNPMCESMCVLDGVAPFPVGYNFIGNCLTRINELLSHF